MIGGVLFTVAPLVLTVAKDVIGLDISIHQLRALPPIPAATAPPPIVAPLCPALSRAMAAEELNQVELARVTGRCR